MASELRCSKPGCGALKIVGKPCTDADCPQQWVHHTDTRPASAATDTGLETVAYQHRLTRMGCVGTWSPFKRPLFSDDTYETRELVTRSQAEELLAAERVENARLRDSTLPMACDPDEWTAAEEVLAHLLINVIGAPDDVPYTPNQAQEVIERQLKRIRELDDIEEMLMDGQGDDDGAQIMPEFEAGWSTTAKVEECLHLLEKRRDVIEGFEADNAALTARIKELEQINADLCRSHGVLNVTGAKLEGQVEALEAKLAAAEKVREAAIELDEAISDDFNIFGAQQKLRAALGGKPSC